MHTAQPHIVVLGAGFGGLTFCQRFRHPGARITLIDQRNHYLFQPLLYQVATAGLSATDIAEPIRAILFRRKDITILMDEAREIDLVARRVVCRQSLLEYDYLVMGLGGVTTYFGHPEWEEFAPGLKSLEDALRIRRKVLLAFERAENEPDPAVRNRLMTVVVIGGGPTGVELAGAFAELARHALRRDFRRIKPELARVYLVEAGPRLLPQFAPELSESAVRQLERFCVEIKVNTKVAAIRQGELELADGRVYQAENIIWAAGIAAHPLTAALPVEKDRAGRLRVLPDLSLPGHSEVFAIGDMVSLIDASGKPVPGVSPAAMQMARHAAMIIRDELQSMERPSVPRRPFRYYDKGSMATIGRSAAVAQIGPFRFGGLLAWLAWLFIHLVFLIGFKNRFVVFFQWAYAYATFRRGARIVTGDSQGE